MISGNLNTMFLPSYMIITYFILLARSSSNAFTLPLLRYQTKSNTSLASIKNQSVEKKKINLFESILRDGEQGARKTLTPDQKGQFAHIMEDQIGVDVIDAGMPMASPLDFAGVHSVVRNTQTTTLSALSYGTSAEIKLTARALRGAEERSRISTFHRPLELSTRHLHSGHIHGSLLKNVRRAVSMASDLAPEVQYYLIYAGNRNPDFLSEIANEAADAGATHIVIADSQSALTPTKAHSLTLGIKNALINKACQISIHCHN